MDLKLKTYLHISIVFLQILKSINFIMWQLIIFSTFICLSSASLDSLTDSLIQQFVARFGNNENSRDEFNDFGDQVK